MDVQDLKKGDIVQHKLSKDWLMVINVLQNSVDCRTKSLTIETFNDFELEPKPK